MADVTKAQRKRAEARQRRRKSAEPEPEGNSESPPSQADGHDAGQAVRQAAKVAAAVGAAGAAAAAARVLTSHDDAAPDDEHDADAFVRSDEPRAEGPGEPQDGAETDEPHPAAQPEPETDTEPERDEHPVQGAGAGDARRAMERAREQLEDLLGRPVEEVSSLGRTHDGWVLTLEVVELQRIPETTDVLASYEMELDDNLNLRRYGQARRYHRGHTDGAVDR